MIICAYKNNFVVNLGNFSKKNNNYKIIYIHVIYYISAYDYENNSDVLKEIFKQEKLM